VDLLEKPLQEPLVAAAVERQLAALGVAARSEEDFNRRLGARIRALRVHAQRTLAEVADEIGLSTAQMSQIELGKTSTTNWNLARICAALNTRLDSFYEGL
jgi:DNA-binding XRE family transcriptional regulator